jgi:PIN domain nuclease of toxin-antitoxin system
MILDTDNLVFVTLANLPLIHYDPFNRLLIAQSKVKYLRLLTVDDKILQYEQK